MAGRKNHKPPANHQKPRKFYVGAEAQARREARLRDARLKASRTAVPSRMCRVAVTVIERTGLVERAEKVLATNVGAPRQLSYRAMLNLLALTALTQNGSLVLRHASTNIFWALSDKQRDLLGLPDTVSDTQFWKTFDKVAQEVGFDVDETTGVVANRLLVMSPDQTATTIAVAGIPDCCEPSPTAALDGTSHESPCQRRSSSTDGRPDVADGQLPVEGDERAPKVSSPGFPRYGFDGRAQHTIDPDVREGYRGRKQGETKIYNGRELHLVCDVPKLGGDPIPPFVRAVAISGAGDDRLDGGRRALEVMGRKPETLLADRGYSYLVGWGPLLLGEGIAQVIDLHTEQRKARPGPIPGTIWVDDSLASTQMPERLRSLPGFKRGMSTKEKLELASLYDERRPYLYGPMGKPDPRTGALRFRGPALVGKVRCENTATSMRLPRTPNRPTTGCSRENLCGCGGTVTLHPEDYARTYQSEPYGTTKWVASYYRRSAIETANGELKRNRLAMGKYSILVRGNRRYSLLLGLLLAALHVIMAEDWYSTDWSELLTMDEPPPKYVRYDRPDTALHRMLARMLVPDGDEDDS